MPYDESGSSFHPWDRGMLVLGTLVVGLALWGVLAAPVQVDGERFWKRRLLRTAGAAWILAHVIAVSLVVRGYGDFRALGPRYAPTDMARAGIPALEYAALGWVALLAFGGAVLAVSAEARKGRGWGLAGTALLAIPFAFSMAPDPPPVRGFLPIPPLPPSTGFQGGVCLYGMLAAALACFLAISRMARRAPDAEAAARARRLGQRAGLTVVGLMAVLVPFRIIGMLNYRAMMGPFLRTSLWGDFVGDLQSQPIFVAMFLLAVVALGMSGFARREAENPAP